MPLKAGASQFAVMVFHKPVLNSRSLLSIVDVINVRV